MKTPWQTCCPARSALSLDMPEKMSTKRKYIMERERHKASGDPHPGSSIGAAAAAENPAPPPRPKLDKEDEAWVKANALPKVKGCTITHDVDACVQTKVVCHVP